jgi:hypothetical protein
MIEVEKGKTSWKELSVKDLALILTALPTDPHSLLNGALKVEKLILNTRGGTQVDMNEALVDSSFPSPRRAVLPRC